MTIEFGDFRPGQWYAFKYLPPGRSNRKHVTMKFMYATRSESGEMSLTFSSPATGFKSFRPDQIVLDKPKRTRK